LEVDGYEVDEQVEAGEEAEDEETGGPDCTLETDTGRDWEGQVSIRVTKGECTYGNTKLEDLLVAFSPSQACTPTNAMDASPKTTKSVITWPLFHA
jgi:hypothetical protein